MHRYPDKTYIQFHLQLSKTGTSGLDDTQNKTARSIHQVITIRYILYDIEEETIDPQSLNTQSIIYYSMVCNILYMGSIFFDRSKPNYCFSCLNGWFINNWLVNGYLI